LAPHSSVICARASGRRAHIIGENMKKILLVVLVLSACYSFCEETGIIVNMWLGEGYLSSNSKLYYYNESTNEKTVSAKYKITESEGYSYLTIDDKKLLYVPDYPTCEINPINNTKKEYEVLPSTDLNIEKIASSSYLKEKYKEYKASELLIRFSKEAESFFLYKNDTLPWVEGVPGDGRNEYISIEFKEPTSNFALLNGYVDFSKKNLFKNNNRVKTLNVTSKDSREKFSFDIVLDDAVKFTNIELPRETKSITIMIKDVYKGNKWDDTCISAIIGFRTDQGKLDIINRIKSEFGL
jgi:hypothetical protein